MVELSRFWDGTTLGDAAVAGGAAYDSSEFSEVLKALAAAEGVPTYQSGVFRGVDNQLALTPGSGLVTIGTGKALVDGRYYRNTAPLNITVPASSLRHDYIVLRKDTSLQTVRLTRIAGTDGSASDPALGTTNPFDMPLFLVGITGGGIAQLGDSRLFIPRHGDQSGEGGTAHTYGQITGAPAASGTSPVNVGLTRAPAIGGLGSYARADHVHKVDGGLIAVNNSGVSLATNTTAVDPLLFMTLENGIRYLIEIGFAPGYSGSGLGEDPPIVSVTITGIGTLGSFPADGTFRYVVTNVLASGGVYQVGWGTSGGTFPYPTGIGGGWLRATPVVA